MNERDLRALALAELAKIIKDAELGADASMSLSQHRLDAARVSLEAIKVVLRLPELCDCEYCMTVEGRGDVATVELNREQWQRLVAVLTYMTELEPGPTSEADAQLLELVRDDSRVPEGWSNA